MEPQIVQGLDLVRAESEADLTAYIAVRTAADRDRPPPRIENLRRNLEREGDLAYLVARLEGEAVGSGFVDPWPSDYADAQLIVVPEARGCGVGSAMLAHIGAHARAAGKDELQGTVRESDRESLAFFERRGYRIVGSERAVALDLTAAAAPAPSPPPGVRIVTRLERPNLGEELFPIAAEAWEDIPGSEGTLNFEFWRATEIDRPTRDPSLFFIALVGDEPIGFASIDNLGGRDAYHGVTAVQREWRRRGVATALKQAQIAAAKRMGLRRLVTESEERNAPMRTLNEKLGYRPEPALSEVLIQGPAAARANSQS
jgi:GNAT superfamily N-acetyltransferase